jgi:hypothetical protein
MPARDSIMSDLSTPAHGGAMKRIPLFPLVVWAICFLPFVAAPITAQEAATRLTYWFAAGYGRGWAEGFSSAEEAFSLSGSCSGVGCWGRAVLCW